MFADKIQDMQDDEQYVEILHELSKYKTLSHSEIDWTKVYADSLDLLTKSLDTRIFRGFILSAMSINTSDVFKKLNEVLSHYESVWYKVYSSYSENSSKKAKIQYKFFTDPINELIESNNSYKINIPVEIIENINDILIKFNEKLNTNFRSMNIPVNRDNSKKIESKNSIPNSAVKSIDSMDNREYREYFFSLARNLLEKNILNFTAYSLFWEGVWGRVVSEVPHKNNITELRYPENNTINLIQSITEYNSESIIRAISNLLLNPFWFEGYKLFIDGAINANQLLIANYVKMLTRIQLNKFGWINKLCFSNNEAFCSKELYDFFCDIKIQHEDTSIETNKTQKHLKDNIDKKSLKARLNIINNEVDDSIKSRINCLINLAEAMDANGLVNNAHIIYIEVLHLMENTLLKDYLIEEYTNIKKHQYISK